MRVNVRRSLSWALFIVLCGSLGACGTTSTSQGASLGAVVGGLAGGWEGAALGALAGGGVGLMADTAQDKQIARSQKEREVRAIERSSITASANTAYRPPSTNRLVGSTWRVISYVSDYDPDFEFKSMVVTFQTNSRLTTLTILANDQAEASVESYRIVDDVIVITGKGYVINARYSVANRQMVIASPIIRIVLEEVEESV